MLTAYLIAGARAKNRFLKLIGITGTRFSRGKRNDNSAVAFASTDVKYLMTINLNAAKALEHTVPPSILIRADKLIE